MATQKASVIDIKRCKGKIFLHAKVETKYWFRKNTMHEDIFVCSMLTPGTWVSGNNGIIMFGIQELMERYELLLGLENFRANEKLDKEQNK